MTYRERHAHAALSVPLRERRRTESKSEGLAAQALVKLKYCNPTGSYKDRMAHSMIEEAEAPGVDEAEARAMARRLTREEGIFTGVSSGLNVVGPLQLARELGPGHTVITVAVDTGLKYFDGDLFEV